MSDRIQFAHTLRGVAALCVVIFHYCVLFWSAPWRQVIAGLTNAPVVADGVATPAWLAPLQTMPGFNLGEFGVALFFLISGFVIPFSFRRQSATGFLVARFFRLVPVYVVGFSVTLLALAVGSMIFGNPWPLRLDEVLFHYVPGLRDMMGSRPIDGVVWTLEVEIKFYMLCAIMAPLLRTQSRWVFAAPLVVAAVTFALIPALDALRPVPILGTQALSLSARAPQLVFMFIGVAFHYAYAGRLKVAQTAGIAIGFLALFFLLIVLSPNAGNPIAALSYGPAIVLFGVAYALPRAFGSNGVTTFFADISYPLYLVHEVMGFVIIRTGIALGVSPALSIPAAILLAILVAWGIHVTLETRAQQFGKRLARSLSAAPAPPLPAE